MFGSRGFDWLSHHPEQAALFQRAMVALGQGSNEGVARSLRFQALQRVVDVGGGHGKLLSAILARNPHLNGVLLDLESGVEAATQTGAGGRLAAHAIRRRRFLRQRARGHAYIMKKVIHDWDDEQRRRILRNCRKAMLPDGRVLVAETIMPEGNEADQIKYMDVVMLAVTGGAREDRGAICEIVRSRRLEASSGWCLRGHRSPCIEASAA